VVRAGAVVWRAPFVNLASWAWRPSYLLVAIAKKAFRQASMTADLQKTTSELAVSYLPFEGGLRQFGAPVTR
jgi:hypothetical protein